MEELQVILGADKGKNAFYKARDNFTTIQNFINQLKASDVKFDNTDTEMTAEDVQAAINELNDNFIELYNNTIQTKGNLNNANLNVQGSLGKYRVIVGASNAPSGFNGYGILSVEYGSEDGYVYQKLIQIDGSVEWSRATSSSKDSIIQGLATWSPWQKIITDKQPNWITATLQNGWTGILIYRKNQIGQLEIRGDNLLVGTKTAGTIICNFPTEYRVSTIAPVIMYSTDGVSFPGLILHPNGNLYVFNPASSALVAGINHTLNAVVN